VSYLLDTNVVSEWTKPQPAPPVVEWLASLDEEGAFLSVISIAELRRGVERLGEGRRRLRLEKWLADDLVDRFMGRILPVDVPVASAWARISVRGTRSGRTVDPVDCFLVATADVHGLTLATRNVGDFGGLGVDVFNPWEPD
jgi:predicted nucleic acid-binding protein